MNADILKGQWKQVKGSVKQWWGQLTDNDLEFIDGSAEKLVGKLQERYGHTKERAQLEWHAFQKKQEQRKQMKEQHA